MRPEGLLIRLAPGRVLRAALARRGAIMTALPAPWRVALAAVQETRKRAPLLLGDAAALHLMACVRSARDLGGAMAEAGVLAGASAKLICEEKGGAELHLFDVFETLQGASRADARPTSEVRAHFGKTHGVKAEVERLLAGYPAVHVHAGVFPETAAGLGDLRFSFVHLDLDLESSTEAALEVFTPRMLPGAILLCDDYYDPALRRLFEGRFAGGPHTLIDLPWSQAMVVFQPQ